MSDTTTTTRPAGPCPPPSLAELLSQLEQTLAAHPELRRDLTQAVVGLRRRLGLPAVTARRDRRGHGLR